MTKTVFGDDRPARQVIRITLVVEMILLLPVAVLSLSPFEPAGFCLAGLAILAFWGVVLRLLAHYKANSLLQEKSALKARVDGLRARIGLELTRIQAAQQMRDYLFLAQKNEATTALYSIQEAFLRHGLASARIADAQIEAMGPKLREELAQRRVANAADIHPKVLLTVPSLGAAERQALLMWRDNVFHHLDKDKPAALPDEELTSIRLKYETENASNNAAEREARARMERLETELAGLQPRMAELAALTFGNYLWETLASQKEVAGISALLLILTQVCMLSSLAIGAITRVPPATTPSTLTSTPTGTSVPTHIGIPSSTPRPHQYLALQLCPGARPTGCRRRQALFLDVESRHAHHLWHLEHSGPHWHKE